MQLIRKKRPLQILVTLAGLVPISAGLLGVSTGAAFFHLAGDAAGKSHGAYLSGLLLGLGLGFWTCVPSIEKQGPRFALLCAIVIIGGLARLSSLILLGAGGLPVWFALAMELLVTPGLYIWQRGLSC